MLPDGPRSWMKTKGWTNWDVKDNQEDDSSIPTGPPLHQQNKDSTTDAEELFYLKDHSMNFKMICLICWNVLHGHTQVSSEVQEE